jgi:hypothetical protein
MLESAPHEIRRAQAATPGMSGEVLFNVLTEIDQDFICAGFPMVFNCSFHAYPF